MLKTRYFYIRLIISYRIEKTMDSLYTGGRILMSPDEEWILATAGECIHILNLSNGSIHLTLNCV